MPGIGGRRVDEHDDRPLELLGEPHRAQRLAVALGPRVAEVPEDLVLRVAALDVADDQHRLPFVVGEAGHDRVVVGEAAVAVNLDEVREQPLDEVFEARAGSDAARPARAATASATRTDRRGPTRCRRRSDSISRSRASVRGSTDSASISFRRTRDRLLEVERFSGIVRRRLITRS